MDNKDYEKLISEAFNKVEEKSVQGLKQAIKQLSEIAHPNDSVLIVLNARYASMVAMSND